MAEHTPSTVSEVAALTARLRALSDAGAAADPAEGARFLADKDQLMARITATDQPATHHHSASAELGLTGAEGPLLHAGPALTAEDAAHELAADGRSLEEARGLVREYLYTVSERVGASAYLWGLDEADLDAIRGSGGPSEALPTRRGDPEVERRRQLAAWHDEYADADIAADAPVRGSEFPS